MSRIPTLILCLVLAAALHADWHFARPLHHRLSLGLPYHWLVTAGVFFAVGWLVARQWPARRWRMGADLLLCSAIIAQVVEPVAESLIYHGRFGYDVEPARWGAFWKAITAGAAALALALWLGGRQRRVTAGTKTPS